MKWIEEAEELPQELIDAGVVSKQFSSEKFLQGTINSTHEYDTTQDNWGQYTVNLSKYQIGENTVYFGGIKLGIADAICSVPSLPRDVDSVKISNFSQMPEPPRNYQRPLELVRVETLNEFLRTQPLIVNPLLLHYQLEGDAISTKFHQDKVKIKHRSGNEYTLHVDMKQDGKQKKNIWKDIDERFDLRPIEIIDGQHRVRSCGVDINAMNTTVPFILLDTKLTYSEAGRLFAEINAQSSPLGPLHQLFLRYILMLPSHKPHQDFGNPSKNKKMYFRRVANRFGFKVGAILNSEKDSPLYNKIRFWDQDNQSDNYNAVNSAEWTKLASGWYNGKFSLLDEEERIDEVREYFTAWKSISNLNLETGKPYSNKHNNDRWGKFKDKKEGVKSYVWRTAVFKSIMMLFSRSFRIKVESGKSYEEIIKPCAHIDFTHPSWKESIFIRGQRVEEITKHLYYWMESAIEDYSDNEELYQNELVWNHDDESEDVLSAPGKGFFSQPNPDYLTVVIHWRNDKARTDKWERKQIEVQSFGVPNNSKNLHTTVEYFDPNERNERNSWKTEKNTKGRTITTENPTMSTFSHRFSTAADSKYALRIRVRVTGGNLFSDNTPLFEQEFTLEQVNNLNDKIIIFRNTDDDDKDEFSTSSSNDDNDDGSDDDDFFSNLEIKSAKKVESRKETYRTPKTLVASERPVEKGGLCMLGFHGIDHTCKICW